MRLLLIRHGQTPANVLGLLDTAHPGPGLTAQPLAAARGLGIQVMNGLHEIEAGDLEGRSDRDAVRAYLETSFAWGIGDLGATMAGGSDGHSFFRRFDADIEAATADVDTAVVFSHGAAIRVWTAARARNVPPLFAGTHALDNTGVVELSGSPGDGWTLVTWAGLPAGGAQLVDEHAEDPTGESLDGA